MITRLSAVVCRVAGFPYVCQLRVHHTVAGIIRNTHVLPIHGEVEVTKPQIILVGDPAFLLPIPAGFTQPVWTNRDDAVRGLFGGFTDFTGCWHVSLSSADAGRSGRRSSCTSDHRAPALDRRRRTRSKHAAGLGQRHGWSSKVRVSLRSTPCSLMIPATTFSRQL